MNINNGTSLTKRELLILKLVAKGCSRTQIAAKLFVSPETVKSHLKNIYRKLEVGNKMEAVKKAGVL